MTTRIKVARTPDPGETIERGWLSGLSPSLLSDATPNFVGYLTFDAQPIVRVVHYFQSTVARRVEKTVNERSLTICV